MTILLVPTSFTAIPEARMTILFCRSHSWVVTQVQPLHLKGNFDRLLALGPCVPQIKIYARGKCSLLFYRVSNIHECLFFLSPHKDCACAAYAPAKLLEKANSGFNWRFSSEQVGGTECSFVCHVPGPRGISPGYLNDREVVI